jgi:hypothetical protein
MRGLILGNGSTGWHYGAWVAIDLRLLIFVLLVSLLAAIGITLLVAKRRHWVEHAALGIVSFTATFLLFVLVLNSVADYPVFSIRSFFPFP